MRVMNIANRFSSIVSKRMNEGTGTISNNTGQFKFGGFGLDSWILKTGYTGNGMADVVGAALMGLDPMMTKLSNRIAEGMASSYKNGDAGDGWPSRFAAEHLMAQKRLILQQIN